MRKKFSDAQSKNILRVIVVAAVSKELRRSAIIEKVKRAIIKENLVASKGLSMPQVSDSITPYRDDRFLVDRNSVQISYLRTAYGGLIATGFAVNIKYGINDKKYERFQVGNKNKPFFPSVDALQRWMQIKQKKHLDNKNAFYVTNKKKEKIPADFTKSWHVQYVSYIIGNIISEIGVTQKNFMYPFEDSRTGVRASVEKAKPAIAKRLNELYSAQFREFTINTLNI